MKNHHPSTMIITILVTTMLSLQPLLTMNSTPPTIGISCAKMEEAGPRSERDEKKIKQVTKNTLVSFHKEQHGFPVGGSDNELLLACQSGHNFYFCDADSKWLRQLKDTTNIKIHLDGPEISAENPQDTATTFPPGYWYPQAFLENVSVSAVIYCCSSPVSSRDCSRGFELVYGDKTSPIPVTATVSETLPSTDAMTDAPTDMNTMLTSSPASMTSPQTTGIPAQHFNCGLIAGVVGCIFAFVFVLIRLFLLLKRRRSRNSINAGQDDYQLTPQDDPTVSANTHVPADQNDTTV